MRIQQAYDACVILMLSSSAWLHAAGISRCNIRTGIQQDFDAVLGSKHASEVQRRAQVVLACLQIGTARNEGRSTCGMTDSTPAHK